MKVAGMGTIRSEADQLVIQVLVYKPESNKAATRLLKTLVNEGVVVLDVAEQTKLLAVTPAAGNKSYWKEVLRCQAWKPLNDLLYFFLPWRFPKGLETFEEYVHITFRTSEFTQLPLAINVAVKPSVTNAGDWSWLPRTYVGKGVPPRDNRYLKLAAAFIYQNERCKQVSCALGEHFRVWTQSHTIRNAPIGGAVWLLPEVSIYSLYQRLCTVANDENRSNGYGLWSESH